MKKKSLLFVICMMLMLMFTTDAYAAKKYYVDYDYLNVRKGPGTNYKKLGKLYFGDEVTVSSIKKGWAKIKFKKKKAYVWSEYLNKKNPIVKKAKKKSSKAASKTAKDTAKTKNDSAKDTSASKNKTTSTTTSTTTTTTTTNTTTTTTTTTTKTTKTTTTTTKTTGTSTNTSGKTESSTAKTNTGSSSVSSNTTAGGKFSLGNYVLDYIWLNMRSGPSTKYSIVGKLYNGDLFNITKVSGDWGYTTYNGISGWVLLDGTCTKKETVSQKNGWYAENNVWRWYNAGKVVFSSTEFHTAWTNVRGKLSSTEYYVTVDKTNTKVAVFKAVNKSWQPYKIMDCSIGAATSPTPSGTYSTQYKFNPMESEYSTEYYATCFYKDYCFHSVLYQRDSYNLYDGRLNQRISNGCVRLALNDAKWLYEKLPVGTAICIF